MSLFTFLRSEMARLMIAGFLVGAAAIAVIPDSALADEGVVIGASR